MSGAWEFGTLIFVVWGSSASSVRTPLCNPAGRRQCYVHCPAQCVALGRMRSVFAMSDKGMHARHVVISESDGACGSFHRHLSCLCRRRCTISARFLKWHVVHTPRLRGDEFPPVRHPHSQVRFHCVLRHLAMFPGNRLCSQPRNMLTLPTCGCMTTWKSVCARYVVPSAAGWGSFTWDML
jgi:hypothetical protein